MAEVHVKWSVILMDLLGPDIFSTLWMKEQVLHRERAHLKVPELTRGKFNSKTSHKFNFQSLTYLISFLNSGLLSDVEGNDLLVRSTPFFFRFHIICFHVDYQSSELPSSSITSMAFKCHPAKVESSLFSLRGRRAKLYVDAIPCSGWDKICCVWQAKTKQLSTVIKRQIEKNCYIIILALKLK